MSVAHPTEADKELNAKLIACLREHDFFESEEESVKREMVLARLDQIVKEWCKRVSLKKNFSEQMAAEAGGKIFTLGSYRLGVHQKGRAPCRRCERRRRVTHTHVRARLPTARAR